jgi:hypothetical protein
LAASRALMRSSRLTIGSNAPTLALLHESEGFRDRLRPLLVRSAAQGGLVHDARIAALCVRYGVKRLLSADRDLSRFPELRTSNPLAGAG